jgi:hypothetical protein
MGWFWLGGNSNFIGKPRGLTKLLGTTMASNFVGHVADEISCHVFSKFIGTLKINENT